MSDLHERDSNFTEAGLTLLLHARTLEVRLTLHCTCACTPTIMYMYTCACTPTIMYLYMYDSNDTHGYIKMCYVKFCNFILMIKCVYDSVLQS